MTPQVTGLLNQVDALQGRSLGKMQKIKLISITSKKCFMRKKLSSAHKFHLKAIFLWVLILPVDRFLCFIRAIAINAFSVTWNY